MFNFIQTICFSVWPDEDDNLVLEKLTRRVEHLMGILAASNKHHSDNFMVINHRSCIRVDLVSHSVIGNIFLVVYSVRDQINNDPQQSRHTILMSLHFTSSSLFIDLTKQLLQ